MPATRRDPGNPDYGTLNADQAITLEQAVRASTLGGAECLGFDWTEKLGSIEKGKLADFIVLDRNIFEIPTETLNDTLLRIPNLPDDMVVETPGVANADGVRSVEMGELPEGIAAFAL